MKHLAYSLILLSLASLCGCAAYTSTPASGTTRAPSVKATASDHSSQQQAAETILAQAKSAMGGAAWNHIHSMYFKGTIKRGGISGSTTELDDLLTGRSVSHTTLGPTVIASGYDGKVGWSQAPGGEASAKTSPAAKRRSVTAAYQTEKAWWYPHRWPAKIELVGEKQAHGETFDVLQVTPRGGNPFKMWINAKTHLIARFVNSIIYGKVAVTHLSDYRTVDGVKIPFHQKTFVGKTKFVTRLKKVAINVPVSHKDFALPEQSRNDIFIIGNKSKVTIPFKPVGRWIYLPVEVNGKQLGFVLDTGAGVNVLASSVAKALGLTAKGSFVTHVGAGAKSSRVGLVKAKSLTIGGKVKLGNPVFHLINLPKIPGNHSLDGLIGPGVFQRFVVRIDYADSKVTFMKHKVFDPSDAGTPVPLEFLGGEVPMVKGSIDGLQGLFMVDTGYPASLTLFSPFAKSHHLYTRYQSTLPVEAGAGLGGAIRVRVARAGKLMIESVAVPNPIVNLSLATKGAFASKGFDGNIGGRILRRFTVTFDFANKRMYLKPNRYDSIPMKQSLFIDPAGMFAKKADQGYAVIRVLKGGPAAKAGLKVGDVITAVNGKPSSKIGPITFVIKVLRGKPGTKVKLTVGKGGAAHTVTITLRRLIPKTGGLSKITPKSAS